MKIKLLIYALVCSSSIALAIQKPGLVDSLKSQTQKGSIETQIQAYIQLCWEYRKSYPDSSVIFVERAIELIHNSNYKTHLPKAYNFLGISHMYKGNFTKAFDNYILANEEAKTQNDSLQLAYSLNNLGRLYEVTGNYKKALEGFEEAIAIFELIKNNLGLAYSYSSMSTLYIDSKDYVRAEEMCIKALEIRKVMKDESGLAYNYLELAKIYDMAGDENKAFETLKEAEEISGRLQNKSLEADIKSVLASLYRQKSDLSMAQKLIREAKQLSEEADNTQLFIRVYKEYAQIMQAAKNYEEAILYHTKVIEMADKSGSSSELRDTYRSLSSVYEALGKTDEAFEAYKKYATIERRLNDIENARLIQQHETSILLEEQERENELLKLRQAQNEEVIREQRYRNFALLSVVIITLVAIVTLVIYSNNKNKYNKDLQRQRDKIESQNKKISTQNSLLQRKNDSLANINLQKDTLMNILAHDLKSPFNRIKGLTTLLEMDPSEQKELVPLIKKMSEEGIVLINEVLEVSRLEGQKLSQVTEKVELEKILQQRIHQYTEEGKSKGIELVSELDVKKEFNTNQVYLERIVDNLLSNAIKYSKSDSTVRVSANCSDNSLTLMVQDEGQGFSEEDKQNLYTKFKTLSAKPTGGESSSGLGLSLVKTLIDRLEGSIELDSELGKGSTFTVVLPELEPEQQS